MTGPKPREGEVRVYLCTIRSPWLLHECLLRLVVVVFFLLVSDSPNRSQKVVIYYCKPIGFLAIVNLHLQNRNFLNNLYDIAHSQLHYLMPGSFDLFSLLHILRKDRGYKVSDNIILIGESRLTNVSQDLLSSCNWTRGIRHVSARNILIASFY